VTGPILVVGGRHRKGSAIPAVPHLAQLQSPTYQWVLTGLPGSTLLALGVLREGPTFTALFHGDRGFESRFLQRRVRRKLDLRVMPSPAVGDFVKPPGGRGFLGFGGLGKGGVAAQIAKHDDDLAAMAFEDLFVALRDDEFCQLRREKPFQASDAAQFIDLRRHALRDCG